MRTKCVHGRAFVLGALVVAMSATMIAPSGAATPTTTATSTTAPKPGDGGFDQDRITVTDSAGNVLVKQSVKTEGKASATLSGSGTLLPAGIASTSVGTPSPSGCVTYNVHYQRGRNYYVVYFTYYVYNFTAYVCYNSTAYGGVVHNGQGSVYGPWYANTWFSNIDPLFKIGGQIEKQDHPYNWNGIGPYSGHMWFRQHHVENCIGIGPVSQCLNEYPYVYLWVHADSTYDYKVGR